VWHLKFTFSEVNRSCADGRVTYIAGKPL